MCSRSRDSENSVAENLKIPMSYGGGNPKISNVPAGASVPVSHSGNRALP